MLKRFLAEKSKSSQNQSPKWQFFYGNLENTVTDTPKRHFLTRNDVFWRILRINPFKGVGCSFIEEPKNEEKTIHPKSTAKSRICGTETAEPIATKFFMPGAPFRT